ncbi:hypothetical protein NEIG_01349 [Nematocida sp. ERTm5]|nr:hypothetical protein NEIG_01349 [Nematocida sp. ERTm5]
MTPEAILRNSERRERRSRFSLKRLARVIRKVGSKVSAVFDSTTDILMCRMSTPESSDSDESIIRVRMIPDNPVTNVHINSQIEESIIHNQEKDNSTTECTAEDSKKCSNKDCTPRGLNVSESIPTGVSITNSKSSNVSELLIHKDNNQNSLYSVQDVCTFCTESTDAITTPLSISEGLYKETSSIRSIIPSSVHKTNHTIISYVEDFIEQLYRIVIHSSPMRDSSYLPVLMLFYLKQSKYTIPNDLIRAEEQFHVVNTDSTITSEDLPDEVVEYLIAEGLEPTVCINYWMAYKCTLEQVYSKFYRSLLTAVLAPNKTHTRTENTLLFYREVLFCVRDLISYSLADMQEELHTNTDFIEETLFTNLLETLSQSKCVREFFICRRVTNQSNNKPAEIEAKAEAEAGEVQVGISEVQVGISEQANTSDQVQVGISEQVDAAPDTLGQADIADTLGQADTVVYVNASELQPSISDQVQVSTDTPEQVQVITDTPSDRVQLCIPDGDLEYTHPSIVYEVGWSAEAQKDSIPLISDIFMGVSTYIQDYSQSNKASYGNNDLFNVSNTSVPDTLITDLELSPLFLKQKTKHDLLI